MKTAARSLVVSTVALLVAGAAQAQSASYNPEAHKPVFTGALAPGSALQTGSPAAARLTERKPGQTFAGERSVQPELAGEPLLQRDKAPLYRNDLYRPEFTSGMVANTELRFDPPAAGPSVKPAPAPRGKSPAGHAKEIADVFRQACLQQRGRPDAAVDWALNQGFVTAPALQRQMSAALVDGGGRDAANVFVRDGNDLQSLQLFSTADPVRCGVMTTLAVDGAALRSSMERFATAWSGQPKTAQPVMSMDMNEAVSPGRMVAYKFVNAEDSRLNDGLLVLGPQKVSAGVAFLVLTIEPAKAER